MRRALDEYLVTGIKTTVPFFRWLLAQPEFVDGRFHTTYLDEVLAARAGRSFVEPDGDAEDIAAIGAALQSVLSSGAPAIVRSRAGPSRRPPSDGRRGRAPTRSDGKWTVVSFRNLRYAGRAHVHYEIEVEGRLRRVVVHRVGDGFAVEVDGRLWHVDAARVDSHTLSLIVGTVPPNGDTGEPRTSSGSRPGRWRLVCPGSGGRSHEVTVSSGRRGRLVVRVGATAFSVTLNGRRRQQR